MIQRLQGNEQYRGELGHTQEMFGQKYPVGFFWVVREMVVCL
jgi:hypothetical protein